MNPNELLKNKSALAMIAVGIIIVIAVIVLSSSGKMSGNKDISVPDKKIKEDVKLLTTSNTGQALEIQALLARDGITVRQGGKGNKIDLILAKDDGITENQRDTALITIVKSGLMDKNIGLEIFDKGDFTSSGEDKKIRLMRARNGELARLIKKIPGIEDASVFVAIPKDTIFTSLQSPTTATVQLVIPPDAEKLDDNIVRAVKNLLMGSIEGLNAENISITDTNGNVYASIMDGTDDMMKMLEDNDNYMKKKIIAQLDKLIGKGNYVVTVSTYLREVPVETEKLIYNPGESSVGSKQRFTEGLGDNSEDKSRSNGAISSYLPALGNPESRSNRNYKREAEEYSYKVGQTRISEVKKPGTLEEISIAVTINKGAVPIDTNIEDLKDLIAKTASPKASAKNVKLAFSDQINPAMAQERPIQTPAPEESGNPWWIPAVALGIILFSGFLIISGKVGNSAKKHQNEINSLLEISHKQEKALEEANQRALQFQQTQIQMNQQLATAAQQKQASQQRISVDVQPPIQEIATSIEDSDERELATTIKSWIESKG